MKAKPVNEKPSVAVHADTKNADVAKKTSPRTTSPNKPKPTTAQTPITAFTDRLPNPKKKDLSQVPPVIRPK